MQLNPGELFTLAQAGSDSGSGGVSTLAAILIAVAFLGLGVFGGVLLGRLLTGQTLAGAKAEAERITKQAQDDAANAVERAKIEAEREILARKEKAEAEIEESRKELRESERRLSKREDQLDKREDTLSQKDTELEKQAGQLEKRRQETEAGERDLDRRRGEFDEQLEKVASMSRDQAREQLLARVEEDSRLEIGKLTRKIVEQAEDEAKEKAREITLMAVQRYATEHASENTVRSVAIPSDDMKGRIIGREGRNIRAIEKATGADIIVDDTPGVIIVSCFDKVRQAIAVTSLERLIADGRMHPTRIEEIVEKTKNEINEKVVQVGKETALEVNLGGFHPKVSEAMGKLHYRTSYGQNVLRHSVEVAYLSQIIAEQLGLDGKLARRCGYLHDIGKAMDHEMEGGHPKIGMDFARQHGEKEEAVLNAIGGHHADIPSTTFYTPIVMAADAVSSARPGARRESMERYVQRLNELQDIALAQQGVVEAHAVQAGREVRVMIDANRVSDDEAYLIAHDIAKRVSDEMTFPGEIKVTVLRETRAIEVAR
ncbi:MAG: ribonuclease Y [Planctomycetota bacterium]